MTARVYGTAAWLAARNNRARSGKAPRLAVRRFIILRQRANGEWYVALYTWRYGRWLDPDRLCCSGPLARARQAARDAWKRMRLPVVWHYAGEQGLRPLRFGHSEPVEEAA